MVNIEELEAACTPGNLEEQDDLDKIRSILSDPKADVNVRLFQSKTPLMFAVEKNHKALVQFLLDKPGINVLLTEQDGASALSLALKVWENFSGVNDDIVWLLVKAGADVDQVTFGSNPLTTAWLQKNEPAARKLISYFNAKISTAEHLLREKDLTMMVGGDTALEQMSISKRQQVEYLRWAGVALKALFLKSPDFDEAIVERISGFLFNDATNNRLFKEVFQGGYQSMSKAGLTLQFDIEKARKPKALRFSEEEVVQEQMSSLNIR